MGKMGLAGAGFLVGSIAATPAFAGTPAGQVITNKATATYTKSGGGSATADSNTVSLTVDELLDVSVAKLDSSAVSTTPSATNAVLKFTVKNEGNGSEAFELLGNGTISGDDFDISTYAIWLDDGDGTFDSTKDTSYTKGSNDPTLASGASKTVFIVSTIPGTATDAQNAKMTLNAKAVTGSGTAGTVFSGKGTGGADAVVGATTASATAESSYTVSAGAVTLTKSATVADIYGGTSKIPGSTITYTIVAKVTGSGGVTNLVVSDAQPANTTYVAGSIKLNSTALTDAVDTDKGKFESSTVTVDLGTQAAGNNTIEFKVKVN